MLEVQNGKFSIKTIKNDYPQFKYREEDEKLLSELVSKSIELFPKDLILHPCFVLHGGIHAMGVASTLNINSLSH